MALTKENTTPTRTFKHLSEFDRGKIKALTGRRFITGADCTKD